VVESFVISSFPNMIESCVSLWICHTL
jgi:hypothetical protein